MFHDSTAPSNPWLVTADSDSTTYSGEVGTIS